MENQTSYKLWHMVVAFLLGAVIVGGVFMIPATGLQGFIGVGKGTTTAIDTKTCGCVDEMAGYFNSMNTQLMNVRQDIFDQLYVVTAELGVVHETLDVHFEELVNRTWHTNDLVRGITFALDDRLEPINNDLHSIEIGINKILDLL